MNSEPFNWTPNYSLSKYTSLKDSKKQTIILGADFAGFAIKERIKIHLSNIPCYEVIDIGCDNDKPNNYPDFSEKLGLAVIEKEGNLGILFCGSGIGIAIACNKIKGIRAATVHDSTTARLTREHNNANVIAIGGWTTGAAVVYDIVDEFLEAKFNTEDPSHSERVGIIKKLEEKYFK